MSNLILDVTDREVQCIDCAYFYARCKFVNYFRNSFIEYVCKNKTINPNKEVRLYPEKGMEHITCSEYTKKGNKKNGN